MKIIMMIVPIMLAGCGGIRRLYTNMTGDLTYKCSKSGVEYIQSDSGIAPHIDLKGMPIQCGGNSQ